MVYCSAYCRETELKNNSLQKCEIKFNNWLVEYMRVIIMLLGKQSISISTITASHLDLMFIWQCLNYKARHTLTYSSSAGSVFSRVSVWIVLIPLKLLGAINSQWQLIWDLWQVPITLLWSETHIFALGASRHTSRAQWDGGFVTRVFASWIWPGATYYW